MVERLPGVDAALLYMETPTNHMHTLKLALLDVSRFPGGYTFAAAQQELAARLHLLPQFRRRLMNVPLQVQHPVWIEDRTFDLNRHVRRHLLPSPGGIHELEELTGNIASVQLDRTRPLWEVHVCEGLADGRIAVLAKMHHAIADGAAVNALLANLVDGANVTPAAPWTGEHPPGGWSLVRRAALDWMRQVWQLPSLLRETARSLRAVAAMKRGSDVTIPRPVMDAPRTSFNGHLTARRSFATTSLSLEDFKKVKLSQGATLNDVVLAVVSGAVVRWLNSHGERPSGSLLAGVPISTDKALDHRRLVGNRISNLVTSLHSDIENPLERLRAISRTTAQAKSVQRALGLELPSRWAQYTPPLPFIAIIRAYARLRAANRHRPPFNVLVSNVAGPTAPLHIAGARVDDLFSVGPIMYGIGLNITVWSYLERMNFSALACPDLLPDLDALVAGLALALHELADLCRS